MIDSLLAFSLRRRGLVVLMACALVVAGLWSMFRLPIDAVPDITNIQVQINTEVPALSPEEIEKQITFPIETELAGLPGLEEVRSLSKFGLSQITLVFAEGADIFRARQLVTERLQNASADLPPGTQPRLGPISTGLGEIYFYALDYAQDATNKPATRYAQLLELRQVQDWLVKPALKKVQGVADVETSGGYEKQIVIQPGPAKLTAIGLGFEQLAKIIAENVENVGGGVVQKGGEQLTIRTLGRVQTLDEIRMLPVKFGAAVQPILVKDVAEVGIGSAFRTGAATMNSQEAVVAYALMLTGENSRRLAHEIHQAVGEIQKKLPPGIVIHTLYNRSNLVDRTIQTVEKNLWEGALFVVAVLFALLGNWRAALIVASAIPLSMLFAVLGMVRLGISGNLMSLGAIDFGLIVDGSVVIAENAVRLLSLRQRELRRQLTAQERWQTILQSCKQVGRPMVFGVAIITLVYVPILALGGIEGKMFRPMALTVIFALIGALLLALTLIPVLCYFFLGKSRHTQEDANHDVEDTFLMRLFKRIYRPLLNFALRFRWLVVLLTALILAFSVWQFQRLGAEFVPQLNEGSLVIQMVRATSVSLEESLAMQQKAEQVILQDFPEIQSIFSRIGTPEIGTDPMGANLADTFLFFAPPEKWRQVDGRRISQEELIEEMTRTLNRKIPGQNNLFTQPIEMRFNEMLEGSRADIAVKLFGEDFATLEQLAEKVREVLEHIPGTADLEADALGRAPVLEITPDRAAMRGLNVHAAELNQVIGTALGGQAVGTFFEGNRKCDIVVRMAEDVRSKVSELGRLPVQTGNGGVIPLGRIAKVSLVEQVNMIRRDSAQRVVTLMVNLRGRDVQSWVNEARERLARVPLPQGYAIEFGGQFKNLRQARERLFFVVPVALALILVMIYTAFGSIRQAALIFFCIPLAVTGGVFALAVRGMPFSISAAIGFIALSGIAVLNGIMLISFINQLRGEGLPLHEAVLQGSLTRLRPKLMTALVASLGFVPMALATGAGVEVQRPLATVVIGGIVSSTFLTLVLLPALYEWLERKFKPQDKSNVALDGAGPLEIAPGGEAS